LGFDLQQLGQPDPAKAHFRRALELDPYYVDAHNNLGKILLNAGQLTEAETEFRQAMQIQPTDFTAHENLGVALLQQNHLDEAIVEFRKAAQSKPDDPEPHKNLADILTKKQRLPEAQQEYAAAVSSADQLGEIHYRIATALLLDDDPDGAIKHFRKSITLLPNNVEAYLTLGDVLNKENRFAEALATLRQGLEVAPNDLRLRNKLTWLLVTSPDASVGKGQKPSNSHGAAPGGGAHGAVPE
jgi:Flp pilus assembly protein TadD